jgi:hypothetical protein
MNDDFSTAYQVACAPGPNAAAAMTRGPGGTPVLVIYLDPVNMTIHSEPSLAGTRELAAFCRELAREAAKLAAEIDPGNEPAPDGPRHLLREGSPEWFGKGEPQ